MLLLLTSELEAFYVWAGKGFWSFFIPAIELVGVAVLEGVGL